MSVMKSLAFAVLVIGIGAAPAPAVVIKKSDNGICHDPSSPSYEKTTKFTSFASLDECVKSGGKPPKK